jgi:hypothetical protein
VTVRFWTRFELSKQSDAWGWILGALLAVFAVAPLAYPGFFQVHSGFLPVFNAEHLSAAPNWGRVADPMRGEGKLPYLLAWPFFATTGSGIAAIKWGYGLAFVLGTLATYGWTRHWLGARGGVLAAVVYTYLPWHLATVYVRGAYAEAWLWALWPLTFWAADRLVERHVASILAGLVAGLAALAATFWTQPGLAALCTPLLAGYAVTITGKRQRWILQLAGTLAALFAVLWMAGQAAPGARPGFADQSLQPFQLLSAAWGDGPSFQLGLAAVGLTIIAVALAAGKGPTEREPSDTSEEPGRSTPASSAPAAHLALPGRVLWYWLAILLILVVLTLSALALFWQVTPFEAFLTVPWQLLALTGLPLSFLAGSAVRLDERLAGRPAWTGLAALVVLASYPFLAPRFTQVEPGPEPVAMFQPVPSESPQIMILNYEITPPTEITPTLTLTLTWQAVASVTGDYTVFVHVLAGDGARIAQRDSRPCDGQCPTNTWQPGEIVVDRHRLDLPPGAPAGPYRLAVGLYLLDTGGRAAVVGRDDGTVFLHVP